MTLETRTKLQGLDVTQRSRSAVSRYSVLPPADVVDSVTVRQLHDVRCTDTADVDVGSLSGAVVRHRVDGEGVVVVVRWLGVGRIVLATESVGRRMPH